MSPGSLLRLFGGFGAIGGALRIAASFIPWRDGDMALEAFYFLIDLCLLFGLFGFFLARASKTGPVGVTGFLLAVSGVALIAGPDGMFKGVDVYQAGITIIATGLTILSAMLLLSSAPKAPAILWLAAIALTLGGGAARAPELGFMIGGILFGAGFIAAGLATFAQPGDGVRFR